MTNHKTQTFYVHGQTMTHGSLKVFTLEGFFPKVKNLFARGRTAEKKNTYTIHVQYICKNTHLSVTQSHADIQAGQTSPVDRTMKPYSIKIQLATSLMLFLAVIDQRCALLIYPRGPERTDPQRVPRRSCRLITANMQNVLLNNEYV